MMGSTPRKGWMKREWAKFPLGCTVRCKEGNLVLWSGVTGTVTGYGIAKNSFPTLHVTLFESFHKGVISYPKGTEITGQLLDHWEIVED